MSIIHIGLRQKKLKINIQMPQHILQIVSLYDQQEPILKILGNTKTPLAPVKSFEFKIEDNKKVSRIK